MLNIFKAPNLCFGFEWQECGENSFDIIDQSTCEEKRIEVDIDPVRIELDNSLIKKFNELSDVELEQAFGSFKPVQSLNPYMTKLSLCSITQVRLEIGK